MILYIWKRRTTLQVKGQVKVRTLCKNQTEILTYKHYTAFKIVLVPPGSMTFIYGSFNSLQPLNTSEMSCTHYIKNVAFLLTQTHFWLIFDLIIFESHRL